MRGAPPTGLAESARRAAWLSALVLGAAACSAPDTTGGARPGVARAGAAQPERRGATEHGVAPDPRGGARGSMDAWAAGPGGQGATQGRSGAGSRSGAGAPSPGDGDVGPGDDALAAFADDGAPLVYEERVLGGARADEALPLVVAVHGLGDSPGGIARLFDGARARVRVVLPRAPVRYGPGWAWFPYRAGASSPDALARGVALAARRLARTIALVARERPTVGAPALCGFSQGGMLSYAVAVLHGGTVSRAMPLAGFLPAPLVPSGDRAPRRPPRVALRARHGDADRVVPIERDRETVRALAALGYDVTLVEEPGVGHVVSDAMTAALHAWLAEVEADAAPTARPLRPAR